MREHTAFPPLAEHMVRVGEETGRLEEMLLKVAETFESDVREELNVEVVTRADAPAGADALVTGRDGDVSVALDTRLTPALRRQGLARHLVHQVQMLRKDAGLDVADRIRLFVFADPGHRSAIEEHAPYVCAETLAIALMLEEVPAGLVRREARLEDAVATIGLERAAREGDPRPEDRP